MSGPVIRLGDKTSHGGVVMSASPLSISGGLPIARVGDLVACPLPGHTPGVIASGDPSMIVDGKPVARHGDLTSCGATLIASQQATSDLV